MNNTLKQERCAKIDELVMSICKLMPSNERDAFFDYQDERFRSGEGFNKKYHAGRYWYKGDRKGQLKDVYIVSGEGFNKLWKLLIPFAVTVVNSFYKTRTYISGAHEDLMSDIKYQTLYVLRFQGPCPYKSNSFSEIFPLICKNIVSNASAKMHGVKDKEITEEEARILLTSGRKIVKYAIVEDDALQVLQLQPLKSLSHMESLLQLQDRVLFFKKGTQASNKTKINYIAAHLFDSVMEECDDESGILHIHTIAATDHNLANIDLKLDAPEHLTEAINCILDGMSVKETAEKTNISYKELKNQLKEFATELL